jgi:hypothetical protein
LLHGHIEYFLEQILCSIILHYLREIKLTKIKTMYKSESYPLKLMSSDVLSQTPKLNWQIVSFYCNVLCRKIYKNSP